MNSSKRLFPKAPEGTAVLFFIVSRLLPAALDRYLRGVSGHVAHPSRSIQIFATLGFAVLYSTLVSVFTKTESPASLDRLAFTLAASRRKVRTCEPLYATNHLQLFIEAIR